MLEEERVNLLEIIVPEVALPQQVDGCHVAPRKRYKLVAEEDRIGVVVDVEVVDREIVESAQAFVAQDDGGEGLELNEVVLWVAPVVGLQQLRQEEDPVGLRWSKYCRLLCLSTHIFKFKYKQNHTLK